MDPMTGHGVNSEPVVEREVKARTNFEDPTIDKLNELMRSDEALEFQRIADAASKTKFATGDRQTDIRTYLQFRRSIDNLLGLLDEGQ